MSRAQRFFGHIDIAVLLLLLLYNILGSGCNIWKNNITAKLQENIFFSLGILSLHRVKIWHNLMTQYQV